MKPDQEMRADMEEQDLEPSDLFVDLGMLVMEGRMAGLSSRGYGQGPHCPPVFGQAARHKCDPHDAQCMRQEQHRKHMMLLWRNSIPMSIEVLLCPDCCQADPRLQNSEILAVPEPSYLLLEQWTIQMLTKRVPEIHLTAKNLLHAVRSYLHFSQLSAWLSLSKGKLPNNVMYRVCVPGEAFSNKFTKSPETHTFPVANVGPTNAMKVTVRNLPRCEKIPPVPCSIHDQNDESASSTDKYAHHDCDAEKGKLALACALAPEQIGTCYTKEEPARRNSFSSPKFKMGMMECARQCQKEIQSETLMGDLLLGDSLLDPPQSLQMYPKRYLSPSRSGSPVIEAPEHLMFGSAGLRELRCHSKTFDGNSDRSRQRHPLIEKGFVRKQASASDDQQHFHKLKEKSVSRTLLQEKCHPIADVFPNAKPTTSGKSRSIFPFALTPKETEEVLHVLFKQNVQHRTVVNYAKVNDTDKSRDTFKILNKDKELLDSGKSPFVDDHSRISTSSYAERKQKMLESLQETKLDPWKGEVNQKNSTNKDLCGNMGHCSQCRKLEVESYRPTDTLVLHDDMLNKSNNKTIRTSCNFPKGILSNLVQPQTSKNLNVQNHTHTPSAGKSSYIVDPLKKEMTFLEDKYDYPGDHESIVHEYPETLTEQDGKHQVVDHNIVQPKECDLPVDAADERTIDDLLAGEMSKSMTADALAKQFSRSASLLKHVLQKQPTLEENADSKRLVPSANEKAKFRKSLDSATCMVFHCKTGLPLTSSPAPVRKGTCFDFDSSLTTVSAIKNALFDKDSDQDDDLPENVLSISVQAPCATNSSLLGSFEESVLNGRLEPVSTVEGFVAEIGASGSFCPRHVTLPVTVFFYNLTNADKVCTPYLGHINVGQKGYHVPKKGTIQVTLFNPHETVVKMFVVMYDLSDMPPNCQTFLRQRTLYMPVGASDDDPDAQKWLRYLIHLRFASSKSSRIFLHTDIRLVIFRKSDMDAATIQGTYELRSYTKGPNNPKFSPRR